MAFRSGAQRRAAFANMRSGIGSKFKAFGGIGLLGGLAYAKVKVFKGLQHLRGGGEGGIENSHGYNNRRGFSKLSRRKQGEVLYRRRAQIRDFENIRSRGYTPGGQRSRSRFGVQRRRFSSVGRRRQPSYKRWRTGG